MGPGTGGRNSAKGVALVSLQYKAVGDEKMSFVWLCLLPGPAMSYNVHPPFDPSSARQFSFVRKLCVCVCIMAGAKAKFQDFSFI